jgi:inward rectifier potassium channel
MGEAEPRKPARDRGQGFGRIHRIGMPRGRLADLYAWLLNARWSWLLVICTLAYVMVNSLFAGLYLLAGDVIANAEPGSFHDAFFFSVQTLSTIGYGAMAPRGIGNYIVAAECIVGLVALAMATGIVFAKFARPTARVLFSDKALVQTRDGVPHLVFRLANARGNQIVEASLSVVVLLDEKTAEGERMRAIHDLHLRRRATPAFALSWTVMHRIDEKSPLHGFGAEELAAHDARIQITLTGIDSIFAQTVHARHAYFCEDIVFGRRFIDVVKNHPDGAVTLDLTHFHDTVPLEEKS